MANHSSDSFVSKKPKRRRQRIVVDERKDDPKEDGLSQATRQLQNALSIIYSKQNPIQTFMEAEVADSFDFGSDDDSPFLQEVTNDFALNRATEIFGEELTEIIHIFDEPFAYLSFKQKVSLLNSMFTLATCNTGRDNDISNFPAFLVYAKGIFPPAQMQELSILCGNRLNNLALGSKKRSDSVPSNEDSSNDDEQSSYDSPSSPAKHKKSKTRSFLALPKDTIDLSPRKRDRGRASFLVSELSKRSPGRGSDNEKKSPRSPKFAMASTSSLEMVSPRDSIKPKPKRGTSLKNFFKDKLIDGEPHSRASGDFTNLQPKLPATKTFSEGLAPTSAPPSNQCSPRSASAKIKKERTFKRSTSRVSVIPEDILRPLFENQESVRANWDSVDPSEPKNELELLKRLWDYKYESGGFESGELAASVTIDNYWLDEPIYENNFYTKNSYNYISTDAKNIVVVSIACVNEKSAKMIMVITYKETLQLRASEIYKFRDILKAVSGLISPEIPYTFSRCKDPALSENLLKFEHGNRVRNYKFGILYCKDGQEDENDMFANNEGSKEYEEFLEFIGNRIPLRGWKKFRGGLDVRVCLENTTGEESIFTIHSGFEIMFHVATMLPFYVADTQQLERKRHLGNDVVLIVYKEGEQIFDPSCVHSEFNHVFIVIQRVSEKDEIDGKPTFKVEIAHKGDIPFPPLPLLPEQNLFVMDENFRKFLLTKMINGERMAMRSKQFSLKLQRTKKYLLKNIFETFVTK